MPHQAEIIAVGTELLLGNIANTNAQFLSQLLASAGVNVLYHTAVGDNPQRLREAVETARSRCDLLVFTGGLGPTYDDMTKETVAGVFGLALEYHPEVMEEIQQYFDRVFHRPMPACNRQQAMLPQGCTVLHNPVGTAPGCIFTAGGVTAVLLPGVPHECRYLAEHAVLPWLRGQSGGVIRSRDLHVFGLTEPQVQELLGDLMDGAQNPSLAPYAKPGEVMLLENLRFYAEEEGKPRGLAEDATDEEKKAAKKALKEGPQKEFVKRLASYADCYINDAFGTAHRAHASTALIADYFPNDKMFGYVMENELKAIDGIMLNPQRPFCAILGGSKVSTKITIIENLLEKVDVLILGGGMTYTFAAAEGGKVGNSICEPDQFQTALDILAKAKQKGVKVVMSPDALIADAFSADANTDVAPANNIPDGWEGVDIAEEGKKVFREEILKCKTILWNGPVGVFEIDKFATGSRAVAEAIAEATSKGAYSLIGGGDSVACINKFGLADKVSYVSTGGGALLEYMEGKVLPGVAAIRK